ncbi:MAG TPA: tetratricopeptide repeat protein [Trebonia sp.]|nr:tetratricopeptide repeat protein [Trebonia sp.]
MAELTDYERARISFDTGDPAEAARLLAPLAETEPRNVSVRLLLARAYFHSAQLRRAEEEFRAVTELDPVEDYAWFGLGRTLQRQSRHADALPCFRIAAAMRPDPAYLDALASAEPVPATPAPTTPALATRGPATRGPATRGPGSAQSHG